MQGSFHVRFTYLYTIKGYVTKKRINHMIDDNHWSSHICPITI